MTKTYPEFLEEKQIIHKSSGFVVSPHQISDVLFPHQNAETRYALRKGISAVLMDTGLGKTPVELEWARLVAWHTDKPVLIVMPLWVAYQTIDMTKELFDRDLVFAEDKMVIAPGANVYVTNYEKLHKFSGVGWGGLVFDESSVFKSNGQYFKRAKKLSKGVDFVLCASATPAPNSPDEIGSQSEVLNIQTVDEMKSTFFINRQDKKAIDKAKLLKTQVGKLENGSISSVPFTEIMPANTGKSKERQSWVLRPHAETDGPLNFYKWLASWAMAVKLPSNLGFSDEGYILPELKITPIFLETGYIPEGQVAFTGLKGVGNRAKVRKLTLEPKCQKALEIIGSSEDQWIVWAGLNVEANRMKQLLGDRAVNVQGSDKTEKKIKSLKAFTNNEIQILISKAKICGHGSNFQNCHKAVMIGMSDSWEMFYQLVKRMHRFGQAEKCEIYVILAEEEREIWENVERKGERAEYMTQQLIKNASEYQKVELDMKASEKVEYVEDEVKTNNYHIMLGDSCKRLKEIESNSVHLSIYSPEFLNLFVYSNTNRDMGNSVTEDDFYNHYGYAVKELERVTMPGRLSVVHVADVHARKTKDGYIGLKDFAGGVIRLHEKYNWIHKGRIPIAKNPQAVATRLKVHELQFQTIDRDATRLVPVQPDYLLIFEKKGKNPIPVLPRSRGEMDNNLWIEWAGITWDNFQFSNSLSDINTEEDFLEYAKMIWRERQPAIWKDIKETEVLSHKGKNNAKLNENDTRHICPLQLEPIERIIKMYSNPGETVLDPFMGSGTTVYQAVMFDRYSIGIELKPEYFYDLAVKNVEEAVRLSQQEDLFSQAGIKV